MTDSIVERRTGRPSKVQRLRYLLILVLLIAALSTRLLPLSFSLLPFNNDGIVESRIASDIVASHHLSYPSDAFYLDTHSVITPVYDVFLAFTASLLGSTPFDVAQFVIAGYSATIVLGGYLISLRLTGSHKAALFTGVFLSLFGTFAFLTSSTWKESLATLLMVLLIYAYMSRSDKRMLVTEMIILAIIPLTHHLVAVFAYLALGYLTAWSVFFAQRNGSLTKRHLTDIAVVVVLSVSALIYYQIESLSRLSYIDTFVEVLYFGVSALVLFVACILVLRKRRYSKISFAPISVVAIMLLVVYDYCNPIFPYIQGTPVVAIVLVSVSSVVIWVAWLGMEHVIESKSMFRAIPLGFLLPVVTLWCYALLLGLDLKSHQIFYRTFDFADLSIGICVALGMMRLARYPTRQLLATVAIIACLLVSTPFGYYTGPLTGVRHDTQEYEIDAIVWAYGTLGSDTSFQSDERLSYVARSVCDFVKKSDLAFAMSNRLVPSMNTYNMFEEEWTTTGANAYPRGTVFVDPTYASELLNMSSVFYVGGPECNSVIIFSP